MVITTQDQEELDLMQQLEAPIKVEAVVEAVAQVVMVHPTKALMVVQV